MIGLLQFSSIRTFLCLSPVSKGYTSLKVWSYFSDRILFFVLKKKVPRSEVQSDVPRQRG